MAETPEEVAKALARQLAARRMLSDEMLPHLASALRAQYVAGLEKALTEARALGRSRTEVAEAIHGLAEQAKRE